MQAYVLTLSNDRISILLKILYTYSVFSIKHKIASLFLQYEIPFGDFYPPVDWECLSIFEIS